MWIYRQRSGELVYDGALVGLGYAGAGEGKNNPALQHVANLGPLPCGLYAIGDPIDTAPTAHGPFVLPLTPHAENEMHGRSGFLMHGDSRGRPGTASHGCIVTARTYREQVWASGDRTLKVVAE